MQEHVLLVQRSQDALTVLVLQPVQHAMLPIT
jgi:hypothetical protein